MWGYPVRYFFLRCSQDQSPTDESKSSNPIAAEALNRIGCGTVDVEKRTPEELAQLE